MPELAGIPIDALAAWGQPHLRRGRLCRAGRPFRVFWAIWKKDARLLSSAGISINKSSGDWEAVEVLAEEHEMGGPAEALEPEPTPAPVLAVNETGLLPWQPDSVRRLVAAWRAGERGFLDASDTGTGKTYVALAFARELGRKAMVICPKAAITSWERAGAALGVSVTAVNYEVLKSERSGLVSWNEKAWPKWLLDGGKLLMIFDEAHRCKAPELTLNAKLLMAAKWQELPVMLLSATLATSPLYLRAAGYALGLHDGRHFWAWARTAGCREISGEWFFSGQAGKIREIHHELFPRRAVRVRHADLGAGFPETRIDPKVIDFGPGIAKVYRQLEARLAVLRERTANYGAGAFTELLAARQEIELLKTPAVVAMARDSLAEGNAVVLFFNFREPMAQAMEFLKIPEGECLEGGQPSELRQKLIDEFQADRRPVLPVNLQTGGVAVSLHGRRPRETFLMPTYSADLLRQALGRVHRAGGSESIQRILFAANSCEEAIAASVRAKLRNLDLLNDGDVTPFEVARTA